MLTALGFPIPGSSRLDQMVNDGLSEYGWFKAGDHLWSHEELSFNVVHDDASWKKLNHALRQAIRWKIYNELQVSAHWSQDDTLEYEIIDKGSTSSLSKVLTVLSLGPLLDV